MAGEEGIPRWTVFNTPEWLGAAVHQMGLCSSPGSKTETESIHVQVDPCVAVVLSAGIVMGKHSGRNALNTRLQQLGFDLSPQEVDDVFRRFKVGCCSSRASCNSLLQSHAC